MILVTNHSTTHLFMIAGQLKYITRSMHQSWATTFWLLIISWSVPAFWLEGSPCHTDFDASGQVVYIDVPSLYSVQQNLCNFGESGLHIIPCFGRSLDKCHAVVLRELLALLIRHFASIFVNQCCTLAIGRICLLLACNSCPRCRSF